MKKKEQVRRLPADPGTWALVEIHKPTVLVQCIRHAMGQPLGTALLTYKNSKTGVLARRELRL